MDSSSSTVSITREQLNAFHKYDRDLFTRLVMNLRRDIRESFQVMSFLLFLEKTPLVNNLRNHLIMSLASSSDSFVNMVADQVVTCLLCLSYVDFPAFVTYLRRSILSPEIPFIRGLTGGYLNLIVIHNNRENILLEMRKHLESVCIPAFEDIRVRAEMYNREIIEGRRMAIPQMSQFLRGQQVTDGGQVHADDRTVFLTFSRGYPVSKEEVHAFFTRRFGEIVVAIHMGGAGGNVQTLYATMELNSPAMIPMILPGGIDKAKFIINGKHVWARRFIPGHKS